MRFNNLPWLTVSSLCLEITVLILVTLVLLCPAPLQTSSLSLFSIVPTNQNGSTSINATNSTTSLPTNASATLDNKTSTARLNNIAGASAVISTAPASTTTSTNAVVHNATEQANAANKTSSDTSTPTVTSAPSSLIKKRLTQLERINSTAPGEHSSIESPIQAGGKDRPENILFRMGPLGSCSRNKNMTVSCTTARLSNSSMIYDYDYLQSLGYDASALPTDMFTYSIVLLVLVVAIAIKVILSVITAFTAISNTSTLLQSLGSVTSQKYVNYLLLLIDVVLAVSTGIKRNQVSSAISDFNTPAAIITLPNTSSSLILQAQTGNSFGYIWISVVLLLISFICVRLSVRRQVWTGKAQEQMNFIEVQNAPRPMKSRSGSDHSQTQPSHSTTVIKLPYYNEEQNTSPPSQSRCLPYSTSQHATSKSDLPAFYQYRQDAYPTYERDDRDFGDVEMSNLQYRIHEPSPTYVSRDHREKERIYMAELRRQMSHGR